MADEQPQTQGPQQAPPPQQTQVQVQVQPTQQPVGQQPVGQQPPGPPPNAEQIIAAQQAVLQQQIASAQQRDRVQYGPAAAGIQPAPVMGGQFAQAAQAQQQVAQAQQPSGQQPQPPPQGYNLPSGQTAQQVAQGVPQQPVPVQYVPPGLAGIPNPAIPQTGGMQPPDLSRLPDPAVAQEGVTVQSLAQGAQIQGAPIQYGAQPQVQQLQPGGDKPTVRWHPGRNSQLTIELADSFISNLPDSIEKEPDPQAKVVAVLLSEILSLRARLDQLEQGATPNADLEPRIYRLEMTLFQQQQALTQSARAVREEAERQAILERQQGAIDRGEHVPVVDPSAQPVPAPAQQPDSEEKPAADNAGDSNVPSQ